MKLEVRGVIKDSVPMEATPSSAEHNLAWFKYLQKTGRIDCPGLQAGETTTRQDNEASENTVITLNKL